MKKLIIGNGKSGMELVQVAILIAIAIGIGLIFKTQISEFINDIFDNLSSGEFTDGF